MIVSGSITFQDGRESKIRKKLRRKIVLVLRAQPGTRTPTRNPFAFRYRSAEFEYEYRDVEYEYDELNRDCAWGASQVLNLLARDLRRVPC